MVKEKMSITTSPLTKDDPFVLIRNDPQDAQ